MQPLECHGFRGGWTLISQTGAGIGCASQDRFELGRFACFLSRHVCARRGFELLDRKSGPWRLLSGQTFPNGIALVAVAGACWQVMARRWCRLSPDQRLHRGQSPCPAHWMDHSSACRSIGKPGRPSLNGFCRWAPGTVWQLLPQPWELCWMLLWAGRSLRPHWQRLNRSFRFCLVCCSVPCRFTRWWKIRPTLSNLSRETAGNAKVPLLPG